MMQAQRKINESTLESLREGNWVLQEMNHHYRRVIQSQKRKLIRMEKKLKKELI